MSTSTIKQNDTARIITDALTFNGSPLNLTGATVRIVLKRIDFPAAAIKRVATIVSAVAGTVKYQLIAADTLNPGTFNIEWEVTQADATILSIPDDGYNELVITPELG